MKKFFKGTLLAGALLAGTSSFAQIQDEDNVTINMELIPILQLNMNTPDQVNFVFDEISEYIGGITQYGATILTVSSTVSWDLFASGTSGAHQAVAGDRIWDAVVGYGPAAVTNAAPGAYNKLPLHALEMRTFPGTVAAVNDAAAATHTQYYGTNFPIATGISATFPNSIYVSSTTSPYLPGATINDPYIAGGATPTNFVNGGSYLTQTAAAGATKYYFVVDYRIVPGLPAIFPKAGSRTDVAAALTQTPCNLQTAAAAAYAVGVSGGIGAYAKPGAYTMNVKYLLIENQ